MPDTFFSCDLLSSEFSDTDWKQLELNDYTLENTTWLNTSLDSLNLSTCHFEQLYFSPDKIRVLIVNLDQVVSVDLALGLILDEPLETKENKKPLKVNLSGFIF